LINLNNNYESKKLWIYALMVLMAVFQRPRTAARYNETAFSDSRAKWTREARQKGAAWIGSLQLTDGERFPA